MSSFSLLIINRAGGLIYVLDFPPDSESIISTNNLLVLASTFQSIHAIASLLVPLETMPSSGGPFVGKGITVLNGRGFTLHCRQTITGIKFVLISYSTEVLDETKLEGFFSRIYMSYSSCVLKNPFYSHDMPIRCRPFNISISDIMSSMLLEKR